MRLLLLLLLLTGAAYANPAVTVLRIDDAITPATADYFARGLKHAEEARSALVVLELDTPGGLDTSMRDMIKRILASPVPVATFVSPGGARAASAGTYILYASHIAAMAPGTNLGAATPIAIGLGGPQEEPLPPKPADDKDGKASRDGSARQPTRSAMTEKQIHDAAAYIRSLAQLRGRKADWAEKAVREAVSLPATDALAMHVVDFVAPDIPDLLKQADGKRVSVAGKEVTLTVGGATLEPFMPDWRVRVLSALASPSLALILMMIGVYGIVFELASPGYVLPGVIGGICLLLALYAFQLLPFTFTGLGLILLGLGFLIAEFFVPTSGVLGVGGVIAFVVGAIVLIDTDVPGYGIPFGLVIALAAFSAFFLLAIVGMAVRARRRKVVTGREQLIGSEGEVLADFTGEGWARVHGETWQVRSDAPLRKGERVRVVRIEGLTLDVRPWTTTTSTGTP